MELLKITLLVTAATAFLKVIIPPKHTVEGRGSVYKGQFFEFIVRYLAYLGCILVSASAFCHSLIILIHNRGLGVGGKELIPWICSTHSPSFDSLAALSPRFAIGVSFVVAGTLLRLMAYHALGPLFTFEVVIKHDHRLITTGPYGIIRHPSYTGLAMLLLGTHLIHFGAAGYVTQCRIEHTPLFVFVNIWRVGSVFTVLSLYRRCRVEDAQLHEQFGTGWEAYRDTVQYCLIPYIY
ncbi:hypothetical protein C8Q80DRAFT_1100382 [Daedaleopsis nitida]|nr:hypothetical protein C8Q80DRAFT_1100382 [Daedaleopsis nitida]